MSTIRQAVAEDKEILISLYNDFITAMSQYDSDDTNMDSEILSWIDKALTEETSTILVSENHEEIIRFARIQHKQRLEDNDVIHYVKLSDLYVVPKFRRKGIAGNLIKSSINWAEKRNVNEIVLNVYEENKSAHNLYEKFYFKDDCKISYGRLRMKYTI